MAAIIGLLWQGYKRVFQDLPGKQTPNKQNDRHCIVFFFCIPITCFIKVPNIWTTHKVSLFLSIIGIITMTYNYH